MRKTGFALHRMLCLATVVAAFTVFLPLASFADTTTATSAQMLPPVISGTTTACDTAHGGILQWSGGNNPITCVPAIKGNVTTGSVAISGATTTMGGGLVVNGGSAQFGLSPSNPNYGNDNSTITIANLASCSNVGGNVGADKSGTLHCCPGGSIVTSADYASVTCGLLSNTATTYSSGGANSNTNDPGNSHSNGGSSN